MYLLVRAITGEPLSATVAGFIYAFALPRIAQLNHMQLLSMQWIPLVVLFLYQFLLKKEIRSLIAFCGFLILQIACSLYLGYLTVLIAGCYFAAVTLTRRDLVAKRVVIGLALAVLFTGLVVLPIGWHYEIWGKNALLTPPLLKAWTLAGSADPRSSYLEVAGFPHHIYQHLLRRFNSEELGPEKRLFMGFVPMTLALIGVLSIWRHRQRNQSVPEELEPAAVKLCGLDCPFVVGSILTSICAYVLSLGPYLRIHDQPSHLRLPYGLLQRFVPGMSSFRVPARFGFAVLFGVAVLAGLGFMRLTEMSFSGKRRFVPALLVIVVLLAISLEFKATPIGLVRVMDPKQVAPEYRWLEAQPSGSVTLELPISGSPEQADPDEQAGYIYASVYHWQPLMNGYTGNPPQAFSRTLHLARQMPDPVAVDVLAHLGLRYVLIHFDRMPPTESERWQTVSSEQRLHSTARFEDGAAIYEVIPRNSVPRVDQ